jgi:hypothetical protein
MKLGHQGMVRILVDEGDLDRRIFFEFLVQGFDRVDAAVAAAKNDNFRRIAHLDASCSACAMWFQLV